MITVVVNVYNGEQYIERCINSLIIQTYRNIEIVIVDDGSKDRTAILIDNLAEKDARIKVYHTENKGIGGSRRFGLDQVHGDYLIFTDADDGVEPDYISALYEAIVSQNAQMAICAYIEEYGHNSKIANIEPHVNINDYTKDLLRGRTWAVVWNKLVKTSIVRDNHITFDKDIRYWEDVAFSVSYSLYCDKVAYVTKALYHYVKNNLQSLTATEGVNIEYNKEKVKNIRIVEHHLERKGKQAIFDMDLLWIKFWIKDVFITHAMSRERIELWRNSFPEVNDRWREIYISSDYLHRAIVARQDWIVLLYGHYYSFRHFIKKIITRKSE